MSLNHPIIRSFPYAINGLKTALKNEPNFRVHISFALVVIILGLILKLTAVEMAILFLTIGFVIIMELINTMLESLVNLVSPEIREHAKIAKDVSAAAVLVSAIISIVIGILLFLPKLVLL